MLRATLIAHNLPGMPAWLGSAATRHYARSAHLECKYAHSMDVVYYAIAPLDDYEVLFTHFPKKENNNMQSAEAFFNQPYSVSILT